MSMVLLLECGGYFNLPLRTTFEPILLSFIVWKGLSVLTSAGQPEGDGGITVVENTLSGGKLQPSS